MSLLAIVLIVVLVLGLGGWSSQTSTPHQALNELTVEWRLRAPLSPSISRKPPIPAASIHKTPEPDIVHHPQHHKHRQDIGPAGTHER